MLGKINAVPHIAVKDLEVAKKFYQDTLGLEVTGTEQNEVLVFKSGSTSINVYRSQYAGTNQATNMTWNVGAEIERIARELKGKGVPFEHYDGIPGMKLEGDLHIAGGGAMKIGWFRDPDGNILCIIGR